MTRAKRDQDNLRELIAGIRAEYQKIGRVWCPILNSYVHFTSEGRIHLIYKGNRKKRTEKEQFYKLRLFPFVVPVIKTSDTIKDWRFSPCSGDIQYYAITGKANSDSPTIRVIIKRTGNGRFNYHSVMIDK